MWKFGVLALALALAGCATPVAWMKADGSVALDSDRQLAMAACQGEMQKSHLSMTHSSGIALIDRSELEQVYAGCMAEKGYVAVPMR